MREYILVNSCSCVPNSNNCSIKLRVVTLWTLRNMCFFAVTGEITRHFKMFWQFDHHDSATVYPAMLINLLCRLYCHYLTFRTTAGQIQPQRNTTLIHWARLCNLTCAVLFCSFLCAASYPSRGFSEAEHHACLMLLTQIFLFFWKFFHAFCASTMWGHGHVVTMFIAVVICFL